MSIFLLNQWKRVKRVIKVIHRELSYIMINKIINKIPSWHIRKLFYLLYGMKIGKGSRINAGVIIDSPHGVVLGDRCIINENAYLDGRGGLIVGNDVSISIYSRIITASHYVDSESFQYYNDPVTIHDHVWIGVGAIVLNGSILNKNVIIGAGCVFKGNAEEDGVYIGNPAIMIKKRRLCNEYKLHNLLFFR